MQFTVVFAVVFAVLVGMISAMPQFGGPGRFFRPGPIIRPPFGRPGGVQTTITKTQSIPNYRGGVTTISKFTNRVIISTHIIGDTGVDGHTMEAIIIIITTDLEAGEVHQQAHNGDSGVDGHTMEVSEVITTDLAAGEPLHHQESQSQRLELCQLGTGL
ncbi:hypothetical protein WR25_14043 [Diploscapter pachys]|uniref:Uncharacterized protein n=1 Tax=Diploscapter pachys TaxID=2018661 RepID=A0A2A2JH49_9BILA|nr:hypothetical protein WR25_14043 [Diploscapter pachys]